MKFRLLNRLRSRRLGENSSALPIQVAKIANYAQYVAYAAEMDEVIRGQRAQERALAATEQSFILPGYCYVCGKETQFQVDYQNAYQVDGVLMPNWRERLICPHCGLNGRGRACIQLFRHELKPHVSDDIYITEQTTPLFRWFREHHANVVGSEYLGETVAWGERSMRGIRNENFTRLSFADASIDHVLSFDVLEHIPAYQDAFGEAFRCLRPRGRLLFSVPFRVTSSENIVRARERSDGSIEHVLPAEYHGDPMRKEGCLCYYHFGWQLLDEVRSVGFEDVYAWLYWSRDLGYLGDQQILFTARKPV